MRIQIRRRVQWSCVALILLGSTLGVTQTASADICQVDDLIVDGSVNIGIDSVCNRSFGFDTLVLSENNLRVFYEDTSNSASFPSNDWRLIINDSSNGGDAYYGVEDTTGGRIPFRIEAGARANALYVEGDGDVGIGTNNPVTELHIVRGDSPTVRLEQDGSSGFTPQTWDVAGNEANFFVRDVTNGSRLPFKIRPSSPSGSLVLESGKINLNQDGNSIDTQIEGDTEQNLFYADASAEAVGIGTDDPKSGESFSRFTVEEDQDTASHITIRNTGSGQVGTVLSRTAGTTVRWYNFVAAGSQNLNWFGPDGAGSNLMVLDPSGNLFVTAVNPSSRELKRDIQHLDSSAALSALEKLEPVEYFYKADADNEHHVGFIAEDVPELVSTKSRKAVDSMEIIALVTKVVKGQQATIEQQRGVMEDQQKTINEVNERLKRLEQQLQTQD